VKSIVHFRQDAETDVADAAAWYENQSAGLGAEFLDEILTTCNIIAEIHKCTLFFIAVPEGQSYTNSHLASIIEPKMI
jgi:hypothetical protein